MPEPRAIARSMFSFGIEYERAFSTAFASARFASGSGPPSRAATMIARESFEKSLPRLASAAPFLCLMLDHLLCPDIQLLPDEIEKTLVDTCVAGELRMERRHEKPAVVQKHRIALELREHVHVPADVRHPRGPDEDAPERTLRTFQREVRLEARDLAPVCVPLDSDVNLAEEPVAREQDHPRAGSEHRAAEPPQRLLEPVQPDQPADGRRFAAGDDEPVEAFELARLADLDRLHAEPSKRGDVLAEVALQGEDTDAKRPAHVDKNSSAVSAVEAESEPVEGPKPQAALPGSVGARKLLAGERDAGPAQRLGREGERLRLDETQTRALGVPARGEVQRDRGAKTARPHAEAREADHVD